VCTVEDPIAYPLIPKRSIVRQGEVGVDFPDRATGVAVTLRLDPDVIYVDQLQTLADITTLVTAAQTGHLAVSVMHAHAPAEAVRTLVEVQPPDQRPLFRRRLAEVLRVAVSQVLLPWGHGKGRIAAYGVMPVDDEMRRAIAEGGNPLRRHTPMPEGYVTLTRAIELLRDDGSISDETARRAIDDRSALGPIEE
jgi:twitching motility protein PilT